MKIHEITLKNFRKFADQCFSFNTETNVTVLIGNNATGKTAILDALSVMMGSYLLDFKVPRAVRHIRKNEVRLAQIKSGELQTLEPQWAQGVKIECIGSLAEHHTKEMKWSRELTSETGKTTRIHAKNIAKAGRDARLKLEQGEEVLLPLLAYYGAGRLWNNLQYGKLNKPDSRSVGYRDCLDPASNHKLFIKWFSRLEQAAVQQRKTFGVLEAVRNAVKTCIPDCRHFWFDLEMSQLMIELSDNDHLTEDATRLYSFNNLSDGYRNMLAMVADIAHRAARLNPHTGIQAANQTPGVVLIDEVDLHLHPKWQREVIQQLRNAFPRIQFIVSTHSPFIIQSLQPGEVIDLNTCTSDSVAASEASPERTQEQSLESHQEQPGRMANPAPGSAYSDSSIEDIIENIMGIPLPSRSARLQKMYEAAEQYYALLEQAKDLESQSELEQLKQQLDELSAPFSNKVAYHAFLSRKRLIAGIDINDEPDPTEENPK